MHVLFRGTVTDVPGFKAAGLAIDLKESGDKDLALIYSDEKAIAAATFTQNSFRAAPVEVSFSHIASDNVQAVIINSGNANACTGEEGLTDARKMCENVAKRLDLKAEEVLVASTGVIGKPLNMTAITEGIETIVPMLSTDGGGDATNAIRTTDTYDKHLSVNFEIGEHKITIGGMAKGSGMIHPNMATMIGLLTTNINIDKALLQEAFSESVSDSYNMISVDGDTSTNDTAMILANGLAGNEKITEKSDPAYVKFKECLDFVNKKLAQMIARDGEGATKLIEATVTSAATKEDAQYVGKAIITSSLVKAAMFGEDGNWGRIISSIGNSGAKFDPYAVKVTLKGGDEVVRLIENGAGVNDDEAGLAALLKEDTIIIEVDLDAGTEYATAWGCDLSYDYVKINADYRT